MSQPTPNFYAVIPATVRYCKSIPPAARLLYGELTALSNREGFCWASNKYFQDLYDASERTIRSWLEALQEQRLINIEIIRDGFQVRRKIWITESAQRIIPTGKKMPEVRNKSAGGPAKNCRYNSTKNNTQNKNNDLTHHVAQPQNSAATSSFTSNKETPKAKENSPHPLGTNPESNEKMLLKQSIGNTLSSEQFEEGYRCYLEVKSTQNIKNPPAWITTAALKKFKTQKDESMQIQKAAKQLELHFAAAEEQKVIAYALNKGLDITFADHPMGKYISYEGHTFSSWLSEIRLILGRYGLPNLEHQ